MNEAEQRIPSGCVYAPQRDPGSTGTFSNARRSPIASMYPPTANAPGTKGAWWWPFVGWN